MYFLNPFGFLYAFEVIEGDQIQKTNFETPNSKLYQYGKDFYDN